MIVLDTNVVSEPLLSRPDPVVIAWLQRNANESAITAITVDELAFGIARLPQGQRRTVLAEGVDAALSRLTVLPFDAEAAAVCARIRCDRAASGRAIAREDAMIAAICLARGLPLATRNTRDFTDVGLDVVDPWVAGPVPESGIT